ncbi:MAG: peroxiredoxin [Oleiphilaceae bacterium]|nr:peroxiredoxin [Oleiphilaceae bacterium]
MGVLVGRPAPDFTVPAIMGDGTLVEEFSLAERIQSRPALIFFYSLDFTSVCRLELIALNHRAEAFEQRGVEVICVSVDSHFSHNAWRNTPEEQGGIGPVAFIMASDLNHDIVRAFDVESPAGMAYPGAFLIDKTGLIRSQVINDVALARNIDELLRLIDALESQGTPGEVSPTGLA